jgi:two-component system response regulator AtoC
MRILVLDDEESLRLVIKDELIDKGHEVFDFSDPVKALDSIKVDEFDCIISDIKMPNMDGLEFLTHINEVNSGIPVVLITAYPDTSTAVTCMKSGAYDYLIKPIEIEELLVIIEKLESLRNLQDENLRLQKALKEKFDLNNNIIGKDPQTLKILENIKNYAQSDAPVLIEGETGTGKELIADAIHYHSPRAKHPYIKVNCSVFSKELIESELFGHVKGAFTGASKSKRGRFETANKGTIFLDEVDDLPLDIQLKLLRVLQNQEIERVGAEGKMKVNIRIIAATKTNLKQKIQEGKFREDFYYRLHVLPLFIPPLREKPKDIPLLVYHFLKKYSKEPEMSIGDEALKKLIDYPWPGNIRELEHLVERLCITLKKDVISFDDLPVDIKTNPRKCLHCLMRLDSYDYAMQTFEKTLLKTALEQAEGNKKKAAQNLNIPYSTLRHRLDKFGI